MQIEPTAGRSPAVTAMAASTPMTMTSPPPTPALNGTLSGIAQQLGMSVSGVQSAIKQGASIADLAQQQGASANSIVQSVQAQIQKTRQASGQAPLDQTTLDRMVSRAVTHHHHRGAGTIAAASNTNSNPGTSSGDGGPSSSFSGRGSAFSALA